MSFVAHVQHALLKEHRSFLWRVTLALSLSLTLALRVTLTLDLVFNRLQCWSILHMWDKTTLTLTITLCIFPRCAVSECEGCVSVVSECVVCVSYSHTRAHISTELSCSRYVNRLQCWSILHIWNKITRTLTITLCLCPWCAVSECEGCVSVVNECAVCASYSHTRAHIHRVILCHLRE